MLTLSLEHARRIAVRAQLLAEPRPTGLPAVIRRLAGLQVDLTTHVAPSADLVLWGRLGSAYEPAMLDSALDQGRIIELEGFLRPAEDLALYRAEMAQWCTGGPALDAWHDRTRTWGETNAAGVAAVLQTLREDGPLPAAQLPDETVVSWRSSGWNHRKNVQMLLGLLERQGLVAVAGRGPDGGRLWDLASRVWPETETVPYEEAVAARELRRLQSLGIARHKAAKTPGEPNAVGNHGVTVAVDGVRGTWQVDPDQLALLHEPFEGRVVLLSPLDRLIFDRKRMAELFEFDYALEMYKPAEQRLWGYWALPVLAGDRLVGKVDAAADVRAGRLVVTAVHLDEPVKRPVRQAIDDELAALAAWLDLAI